MVVTSNSTLQEMVDIVYQQTEGHEAKNPQYSLGVSEITGSKCQSALLLFETKEGFEDAKRILTDFGLKITSKGEFYF